MDVEASPLAALAVTNALFRTDVKMMNQTRDEEVVFQIARELSDSAKRAMYLDQVCAGE